MAQPTTIKDGSFILELGDGATPEVFSAPCGFTQKSLTLSSSLSEVLIPDCNNPDAPIYVARDVQSKSLEVSGEGVLAAESLVTWINWYKSAASKNIRLRQVFPAPTGTITFSCAALAENIEFSGSRGNGRVTINVSIASDGEITFTGTGIV